MREWGSKADDNETRLLRGRKHYWLTGDYQQRPLFRVTSGTFEGDDVETVSAGTQFTFTVRFENLDLAELGGLLAALDPSLALKPTASEKEIGFGLGGGRPFGFGSCTAQITALDVHTAASWYGDAPAVQVNVDDAVEAFAGTVASGVKATWRAISAALTVDHVPPEAVWYPPARAIPTGQFSAADLSEPGFEFWKRTQGVARKSEIRPMLSLPDITDTAHMRSNLPAAELQIVAGEGEDYLRAYVAEIGPRRATGDVEWALPAIAEFPAVRRCGVCRMDPAVPGMQVLIDEEQRVACLDCSMRYSAEGRARGKTAEAALANAVGGQPVPGFDELAALGNGGTQIATIYADGNGIGDFFAALANLGSGERKNAVGSLNKGVREALAAATCAVRRDNYKGRLGVVPHLVAGDELLVSVPADRAWRFTAELLTDFADRAGHIVPEGSDLARATMSAGLVFARKDFSFALAVEDAERALKAAKTAGEGWAPLIRAVDVTAGGAAVTVAPHVLKQWREELDRLLADIPAAGRVRLAQAVQEGGPDAAAALARRLGRFPAIEPFLAAGPDGIDVVSALRIARWWKWK